MSTDKESAQLWDYNCLECNRSVTRCEDDGDESIHEWLWCDKCCGLMEDGDDYCDA